mmetsp:Transcript_86096/g.240934  ORF Transcript_86096/g.240934 Transcript_86096/m.240934 type:complete len:365 (-) Transcript_86096:120-1214(-)
MSSLHHTWLGGFLVHFVLAGAWIVSPFVVILTSFGMARATYWASLLGIGPIFFEGLGTRRLLSWTVLALDVCFAPSPGSAGVGPLVVYWTSLLGMAFNVAICYGPMSLPKCPQVLKLVQDYDASKYYTGGVELKGALSDIKHEGSLFGFHPHGILCCGFSWNGIWSKRFHELAGEDSVYMIDKGLREDCSLFKLVCDAHGSLQSLTKKNLAKAMAAKKNVAFVPGGFEDATLMEHGKHSTAIRKRTGFIKYALQHGCRVHACYTFGETDSFTTFTGFKELRLKICAKGIPAVSFFGFPLMPFLPKPDIRLVTYVSEAIKLPKIEEPTTEDVLKWHKVYCDTLVKMFESGKKAEGLPDDARLEIL